MADRFPLVANSSTSQIQEIPHGDTLDLSGNNVNGVGIITATTFSGNLTGSVTGNVTGNVTGTATTATGLSGTPNITVGTVTGTDATFSGNLTVQGTTTTIDTAVTAVDSLNVDGAVVVGAGISAVGDVSIGSTTEIFANGRATFGDRIVIGTIGSSAGPYGAILGPAGSNRARLFFYSNTTGEPVISIASSPDASTTKTVKATIGNNGSASFTSVSDSIGPLRRLGIQGAGGSFSFAADMAGKLVRSTGNGSTLTIPQNVFSAGDMISVFNVSTGDNTIAQGTGATLYNTADGATGNRTLGPKGVCTILCTATNEFIISGSQVS